MIKTTAHCLENTTIAAGGGAAGTTQPERYPYQLLGDGTSSGGAAICRSGLWILLSMRAKPRL